MVQLPHFLLHLLSSAFGLFLDPCLVLYGLRVSSTRPSTHCALRTCLACICSRSIYCFFTDLRLLRGFCFSATATSGYAWATTVWIEYVESCEDGGDMSPVVFASRGNADTFPSCGPDKVFFDVDATAFVCMFAYARRNGLCSALPGAWLLSPAASARARWWVPWGAGADLDSWSCWLDAVGLDENVGMGCRGGSLRAWFEAGGAPIGGGDGDGGGEGGAPSPAAKLGGVDVCRGSASFLAPPTTGKEPNNEGYASHEEARHTHSGQR